MGRRVASEGRSGTATSAFGVSRREGHDAEGFYSRFSPPVLSSEKHFNPVSAEASNRIFCADSRSMSDVPDASVALVVTSPPYFAGKEYEQDLTAGNVPSSYLDYLKMLEEVFAECVRKLEPGGRIAINVANLGRRPYRSLSADVINILQDKLRLLMRGEVIWQKALGSAGSCAWGSFQRPSNPVLRDVTERILIASKGRFSRALSGEERRAANLPCVPSLSKDEFMEATTDVWHIPSESATRVGHPAPFPTALPLRLINLYTYEGDLVLDPFLGSGTTAVAALSSGRKFVGYETDPLYVELCKKRLAAEGDRTDRFGVHGQGTGSSVKEFAENLLSRSGFSPVEREVPIRHGLQVGFRSRDAGGRTWLFELAGAFSISAGPGLGRSDILWKALGRAAVLHQMSPETPLALLSTGVPDEGTPAGAVLSAMCGPGKPIACAIDLTSEHDRRRLAEFARAV